MEMKGSGGRRAESGGREADVADGKGDRGKQIVQSRELATGRRSASVEANTEASRNSGQTANLRRPPIGPSPSLKTAKAKS